MAPRDVLGVPEERRGPHVAVGPGLVEADAVAGEVAVVDARDRACLWPVRPGSRACSSAGLRRPRAKPSPSAGSGGRSLQVARGADASTASGAVAESPPRPADALRTGKERPQPSGGRRVPGRRVGGRRVGANRRGLAPLAVPPRGRRRRRARRDRAPAGPRRRRLLHGPARIGARAMPGHPPQVPPGSAIGPASRGARDWAVQPRRRRLVRSPFAVSGSVAAVPAGPDLEPRRTRPWPRPGGVHALDPGARRTAPSRSRRRSRSASWPFGDAADPAARARSRPSPRARAAARRRTRTRGTRRPGRARGRPPRAARPGRVGGSASLTRPSRARARRSTSSGLTLPSSRSPATSRRRSCAAANAGPQSAGRGLEVVEQVELRGRSPARRARQGRGPARRRARSRAARSPPLGARRPGPSRALAPATGSASPGSPAAWWRVARAARRPALRRASRPGRGARARHRSRGCRTGARTRGDERRRAREQVATDRAADRPVSRSRDPAASGRPRSGW